MKETVYKNKKTVCVKITLPKSLECADITCCDSDIGRVLELRKEKVPGLRLQVLQANDPELDEHHYVNVKSSRLNKGIKPYTRIASFSDIKMAEEFANWVCLVLGLDGYELYSGEYEIEK